MPIQFSCPVCVSSIEVPDTKKGQQSFCPFCGETIRIPGDTLPPLKKIPPGKPKPAPASKSLSWLWFLLGVGATSGLMVVFFFMHKGEPSSQAQANPPPIAKAAPVVSDFQQVPLEKPQPPQFQPQTFSPPPPPVSTPQPTLPIAPKPIEELLPLQIEMRYLTALPKKYLGKKVQVNGWADEISSQKGSRKLILLMDRSGGFLQNLSLGLKFNYLILSFGEDFPSGLLRENVTITGMVALDKLPRATQESVFLKEATLFVP